MQTGQSVDMISFAFIGTTSLDNGRTLYLLENRYALGIYLDYQEITPEHVLLHRLVVNTTVPHTSPPLPQNTLRDGLFTPPLPILRAPLEVGRSWTASVKHGAETYSYVAKVESRATFSLGEKTFQDCLWVVRTRDGTPNYKTMYCPTLGIAAIEQLLPNGKWFRAELFAITSARLVLTGVRVAPSGCEHIFDHVGFLPDEDLLVTIDNTAFSSGVERFTSQRHSSEYIHVSLGTQARYGRWRIEITGTRSKAFAYYVINWTGACQANFLSPSPALRPSLTLIGQEADEERRGKYLIVGSGWRAGESLTYTRVWSGQEEVPAVPIRKADDFGVSAVIVSSVHIPGKGMYTFTLQGETQTATLTVECREDGVCFVK